MTHSKRAVEMLLVFLPKLGHDEDTISDLDGD